MYESSKSLTICSIGKKQFKKQVLKSACQKTFVVSDAFVMSVPVLKCVKYCVSCMVACEADILVSDILKILPLYQARSPKFTVIGYNVIRPRPLVSDWSMHHLAIPPVLYIYLVHIILNQCSCQVSRHSGHKQWCCVPVTPGREMHELSDIWSWPCQLWPQLACQYAQGWI